MIEMQVRVYDPPDVAGLVAQRAQRILQLCSSVLARVVHAVDVDELGVFLVTDPGIDQDQTVVMLDEQAAQGEGDLVAVVGRSSPRPERLWVDAKHRPAMEVRAGSVVGVAGRAT